MSKEAKSSKSSAKRCLIPVLIALVLLGVFAPVGPASAAETGADRLVVVINEKSSASKAIGEYYAQKRGIPPARVCRIECPTKEVIVAHEYRDIANQIRSFLDKRGLKGKVDYIVTTKGIPIKFWPDGLSVDSAIGCLFMDVTKMSRNPYFGSTESFSTERFSGLMLVCRLDAYTVAEAKKLVDRALNAKPRKGLFLLDGDPSRSQKGAGYVLHNRILQATARMLKDKGYEVRLDESLKFIGGVSGLMGIATWGSNHRNFSSAGYKALRFEPGAIGETFVSTSGRTFSPTSGGQSLVADLISGGITGVKGYVSEPYTAALANAALLFDRYTSGLNLAESFYAASPMIYWKDVVIGDPLCRPYPKQKCLVGVKSPSD